MLSHRCLPLVLLALLAMAAHAGESAVAQPKVFTDERAVITTAATGELAFTQRLLTVRGWEAKPHAGTATVVNGHVEIAPLGEGINVVAFADGSEARFLGMTPPPMLDRAVVLAALPRSGAKLLAGEPFSILAMGDSVTWSGDYAGMLARLLGRATGNQRITVTNRSYPGCSADATARMFEHDVAVAGHPDLGLMMYGLNDQVCFVPLEAVLDHYRFVAEGLSAKGADTIFLQPTPHIDIPQSEAERKPESNGIWFAFRTIGFAEALRPLARELHVPLAETFAAIWGNGGDSIQASARAMWPVYPQSYDRQFSSMIESAGGGDTIHPNALGHLAMARACLTSLAPPTPAPSLDFSGTSRWTEKGVISTITVTNRGSSERSGRFEIYQELGSELQVERPIAYKLAAGATKIIEVGWPHAQKPQDLLKFPNERYLAPGQPVIPLLDFHAGGSQVHAVAVPFAVKATFTHERSVCTKPVAQVSLLTATGAQAVEVPFPANDVGRVPLVRKVDSGWAVAELAYVRYAGAVRGECVVDGDLSEWAAQVWRPVGEPCQARYANGPDDKRASSEECRLTWSCRAGSEQMHVAMRVQGQIAQDSFFLFLDPRAPEKLGTVGRYYWLSGSLKPDGIVQVSGGETSPGGLTLTGRWRANEGRTDIEFSFPYTLFEQRAWPTSGDLGLGLWWTHRGADAQITQLQWSEDGHAWNPRWYGVVRLQDKPDSAALPWMVRVR